jgi:DNA (cytosine-5)-methyltransferase 1
MVQMGYGERNGQAPRSLDIGAPLGTVVAGGAKHGLVTAHLEKFSENSRGKSATDPLDAVMAGAPRHAVVSTFLSHFYTSNTNGGQGDPLRPANTVTSGGQHHAVVCAHMEQANTGAIGHDMRESVSTIVGKGCTQRLVETTLIDADALPADQLERAVKVAAFLIKYYGNETDGHGLAAPIGTVTTKDRFAVVTVTIDAVTYVIVDIGMRMLNPRELANAQGFPRSYVLEAIGPNGKPLTKSAQIRMIGNSVCPDMAEALVSANLPELCVAANADAEAAAA